MKQKKRKLTKSSHGIFAKGFSISLIVRDVIVDVGADGLDWRAIRLNCQKETKNYYYFCFYYFEMKNVNVWNNVNNKTGGRGGFAPKGISKRKWGHGFLLVARIRCGTLDIDVTTTLALTSKK